MNLNSGSELLAKTKNLRSENSTPNRPRNKTENVPREKVTLYEPSLWLERMTLYAKTPLPLQSQQHDDDPVRESCFISHGLTSAIKGVSLLGSFGVLCERPPDYYAEMLKSDTHMSRIRDLLSRSKIEIRKRFQQRERKRQKKFRKETKKIAKKSERLKQDVSSTTSNHAKKKLRFLQRTKKQPKENTTRNKKKNKSRGNERCRVLRKKTRKR